MVVAPKVNWAVVLSKAISTFSTSLPIMERSTPAGFLCRMKEAFSVAFTSLVV